MKRTLLAVVLCAAATGAFAQAPAAAQPGHACGEKPEWPGRLASDNVKRGFEKKLKAYGDCIKAFVADRQAAMKAIEVSANAAITEYNSVLSKVKADQEAEGR